MKMIPVITFALFTVIAAHGQLGPAKHKPETTAQKKPEPPAPTEHKISTHTSITTNLPNAFVAPNARFNGIAVQAVKSGRPLQMINPCAPAEFGNGEANVSRDPRTGQQQGLKLFVVKF